MKFPEIKKKVNSFLLEEEGKISKKNMIMGGVVLSAAAMSLLQSAKFVAASYSDSIDHVNSLEIGGETDIRGSHNHHLSHASHEVHNSY